MGAHWDCSYRSRPANTRASRRAPATPARGVDGAVRLGWNGGVTSRRTVMLDSAFRAQEVNPAKLAMLFKKQFELCKVKPGETIACVSDLSTRREYIQASFAAAEALGADVYEMSVNMVPGWTKVGVPTIGKCKGTLDALKAADMIAIFHVPLFAKWLKEVRAAGARVQMIIDAPDDLEQLMSPPGLREATLYAAERYGKAREVRVVSAAGTDLRYAIGEYKVMSQWGHADAPGRFDHWGGGHIHTFPNEGSAQGTVVFQPGDIVILPYCRYVQDPVRLRIENGFIVSIEGGLDAKLMRDWLDDNKAGPDDRDPYAVSHLGWGLNPQSLWYGIALNGDTPERSRAAARTFPGNFLFSTGPNSEGGGRRTTRGHYDVPMRDCTVILDNEVVIEKGKFADPRMIVPREQRG
jgi:2,5-dihydroxypyridine 5,6-dioxygenase